MKIKLKHAKPCELTLLIYIVIHLVITWILAMDNNKKRLAI